MAAAGAQIYLPVLNRVLIASADPLFRLRVMKKAVFASPIVRKPLGARTHWPSLNNSHALTCCWIAICLIWIARNSPN